MVIIPWICGLVVFSIGYLWGHALGYNKGALERDSVLSQIRLGYHGVCCCDCTPCKVHGNCSECELEVDTKGFFSKNEVCNE